MRHAPRALSRPAGWGTALRVCACVAVLAPLGAAAEAVAAASESNPGALPASTGSIVWPQPAAVTTAPAADTVAIGKASFTIDTSRAGTGVVAAAAKRYLSGRIFAPPAPPMPVGNGNASDARGVNSDGASKRVEGGLLTKLQVIVGDAANESLALGVDESYNLTISASPSPSATLEAATVWGALRGLETFAQSVFRTSAGGYEVSAVSVSDAPRFSFRGILVDTARHFINTTRLQDIVEAMVCLKLNVMMMHMTDDQSFPFASTTHPNITKYGAFGPNETYSHADMAALAAYAKARGVWIQVELDLPAHAASWRGQYDFAWCSSAPGKPGKPGGGLPNPALATTFATLSDLYGELAPLVSAGGQGGPKPTVHLGGDEVERNCWTDDSTVQAWADKHGYRNDLQAWDCGNRTVCSTECAFHVGQAGAALKSGFGSLFMWEDARGCEALLNLDGGAIVDVWDQGAAWQWQGGLTDTLRRGWRAVVSSGCYFLEYPPPWEKQWGWQDNYACDVQNVTAPAEQLDRVVGGHASRWGETTTGDNWFDHVFPSLAGTAEKLWSPLSATAPASGALLAARTPAVRQVLCRIRWLGLGPFNVDPQNNPLNGTYYPWPSGFCE